MFMHGGWTHLGGNMLYLYIFGDNVEDAMGHVRYVFFYLLCGVAAAAVQVGIAPFNRVPIVGASGAIAGVLGGYIVLYPRAPVNVVNPVLPLWLVFGPFLVAPAWAVIGIWFVWNLYSGFGQLTQVSSGGVAFFAHIGGFVAGMLMVRGAVAGRRRVDRGRWSGWRGPSRTSWSSRAPRSW
jgi:membrane associated rhomboid family serine protease